MAQSYQFLVYLWYDLLIGSYLSAICQLIKCLSDSRAYILAKSLQDKNVSW